ncbi:MAG: GatB/YqeY domain-containing protein [Clostridia bacterium]|nr:GatB/YqeY domain-containing protein [Clostridia bacterium]
MSLKERLLEDMKIAMRDRDVIRKNTIQMARSAVLQVEKDSKVTLDDDGIIEILAKEVKKRRDSLPDFEKSGRQDLVDNLKSEIDVLLQYLPQQLSDEELEAIVKQAIQDTGATSARDMGKIMQAVMPSIKGRADGKMVNQIVKKILG